MTDDRLDRMGAFDAVMWGIEQDPILRSVIVAMAVLDREPDLDVLVDRITRMTLAVPKLRQRVIGNPVSLVPPRWEFDPHFDLGYHLKRYNVAPDGTDRPLLRMAEQLAEQDFDRDRPLWEVAVIAGFDGPRSAVIIKLHHAITDGVGGMAMAATLFDLTSTPRTDLGPRPEIPTGEVLGIRRRVVNGAQYALGGLVRRGQAVVREAGDIAVRVIGDPGASAVAGAAFAQSAARLLAPASEPLSPVMARRSLSTHAAVLRMPFGQLKAASRAAGATINDVYLAAVSAGLATYHDSHHAPAAYVRVNMPVNQRTDEDGAAGNRWVPARFELPLDSGDPTLRIQRLAPLLAQARTEPALVVTDTVYRLLAAVPQGVATSISGAMMKGVDVAVTNLPGPPIPLYLAGARVTALVPFAPKAGAAVNLALMTYDGTAIVGLTMDPRAIPDSEVFVECMRAAFDQVLGIATPEPATTTGLG